MANKVLIYIHGKGGRSEDSEYYKPLFPEYDVMGFDYKSDNPWEAEAEYRNYFTSLSEEYTSITVIASSLGAFFLMISNVRNYIEKAFFVSPIVDMERLIMDMMLQSNVSEDDLKEKDIIRISQEDYLSWEYLDWVRKHPILWDVSTFILYGENDHLQTLDTMIKFAKSTNANLTVMPNGEHWFHTDEQNEFRWNWLIKMNR